MQTIAQDLRGIPLWLLREYLQEMGGVADGEAWVRGDGWAAHLERLEPYRIGSLAIGQVRVVLQAEDRLADDLVFRLGRKTLRAGG